MLETIRTTFLCLGLMFGLVAALGGANFLLYVESGEAARWYTHLFVWVGSVLFLSTIIYLGGVYNIWTYPGQPREQVAVQQPMPTPTITLKADLPGTPTAADCDKHIAEFKAKNSFSTSTVVVGECS